jgi:hypothetical protein
LLANFCSMLLENAFSSFRCLRTYQTHSGCIQTATTEVSLRS